MSRELNITVAATLAWMILPASAQTPPVQPNIQQTPLPPPVELSAPESVPADVPNRPLTANEAAAIALRYQPSVTVSGAAVEAARGRTQQSRSGLLPSLTVSGAFDHSNGGSTGSNGSSPDFQVAASVDQLLFDFNHTRNLVKQAQSLQSSAGAGLTRTQSDLVLQVKQAFYSYQQNTRLVGVNESNLRNAQNHLALAEARLKAGVGLPSDVVRAQTTVADAVFALNLARNNASISQTSLAQLMGIDPRTPIRTADSSEPAVNADDLNALVGQALRNRPEVVQAQSNITAARYGIQAARTVNSPLVSASVGWRQRGDSFPPGNDAVTAGVSVRFTPFDSGFTAGRVREAQANQTAAEAQLTSVKLGVTTDVSQAYLNLKTAEQRVVTADAEVANAEEGVRLAEGRYRSGLGTFLDVLDAQTALVTANTNRVNARAAVDQARASLAHAVNSDLGTVEQTGRSAGVPAEG